MEPGNVTPLRKIGEVEGTGEAVMAPRPTTGQRRKAAKKGHRVAMVDFDVFMLVELTNAEHQVFAAIVRHIPDRGGVQSRVGVGEIAELLGMKQPSVSRVIKDLLDRRIIRRVRQGVWDVNPHILYNGEFTEWNDSLVYWHEPIYTRNANTATGEVK